MPNAKVAVITGSTGGIGSAIAHQLADEGWTLVLVNRNAKKSALQKEQLTSAYPRARIDVIRANLMDTDQVKQAALEVHSIHPKIDVLYNNSGVLTSQRINSVQGHESNYAINTLAPYVMIECLRSTLKREDGASRTMIINTTSSAQNAVKSLNIDALSNPEVIGGLTGAYAATKLALTTIGTAMADGLAGDGIMVRSVCPGTVATPMTKTSDAMPGLLKLLVPFLFNKPEKQAGKMIYAAKADTYGNRTGIYITNGKEKTIPKHAVDPETQAKLMKKLSLDAAL
ncbi:MAG: SDR family NAD(P)-dependent oxidoreductase [Pseudomonadota bacterium]